MNINSKIKVKKQLNKPVIETESFTITCFDELINYKIYDAEYNVRDITDVINLLMNKLKYLGHDGIMKIDIVRMNWYEKEEIPLNELNFK